MSRLPRRFRRPAALGVLALGVAGGAVVAHADGGGSSAPVARVVRPAAPARPTIVRHAAPARPKAGRRGAASSARPVGPPLFRSLTGSMTSVCVPDGTTRRAAPPSDALLNAFGVLRRDRQPGDTLPREALEALRARGLSPVSADSARLLRSGPDDGRAWIVPVPDVDRSGPGPYAVCRGQKPPEGVAVVAVGRAQSGGGGTLTQLLRGQAPVAVDPCSGDEADMLGVSGVVPDNVPTVFLTAPDGTAVRADVHDNGFAFVVPRPSTLEPRYIVWTGADGTPHVQPVPPALVPSGSCRIKVGDAPVVTPSPFAACGSGRLGPFVALPAPAILPTVPRIVPLPRAPRRPSVPKALKIPRTALALPAPPPGRPTYRRVRPAVVGPPRLTVTRPGVVQSLSAVAGTGQRLRVLRTLVQQRAVLAAAVGSVSCMADTVITLPRVPRKRP